MPTITFDVVPFFFAVLVLLLTIYQSGEESSAHSGFLAMGFSVICTVLTYVLFVGIIAIGGG